MHVGDLESGGSPILGEPLPIEFANTSFAVRGTPREGLGTPEQLAAWLRDMRERLPVTLSDQDLLDVGDAELDMARTIRDSVRELAASLLAGQKSAPSALLTLNNHIRHAPRWHELCWGTPPTVQAHSSAPPLAAALSAIAEAAAELLAAECDLRACHGPGCVLLFVKNHPRREWCSPGCSNRARAARHYDKVRHTRR